jgi:hypothetical protein
MQLHDRRVHLGVGGAIRACVCVALAAAAGCQFESAGTGEARPRRSGAFGSIGEDASREDEEAARIVADWLRASAQDKSAAGAQGRDPVKDQESAGMPAGGAKAERQNPAGMTGGQAGMRGSEVRPPNGSRVMPAADGGVREPEENDAGDDSDAGTAGVSGTGAPPLMAAGAGGASAAGMGAAGVGTAGQAGTAAAGSSASGGDTGRAAEGTAGSRDAGGTGGGRARGTDDGNGSNNSGASSQDSDRDTDEGTDERS